MNWYYYDGAKQVGPISEAELLQARQSGVINDSSLVWREGMANWIPFREALPAAAVGAGPGVPPQGAPGAGEAQCCECRGFFPSADMIRHGELFVCANCKPIFLQKLSEGIVTGARRGRRSLPVDPDQLTHEILSRGYALNIGTCISRGFNAVKARYGVCLGASVLIMLCNQAAGMIPFLGVFLSLAVSGPLTAGLCQFFINVVRGDPVTVGDAFSGFKTGFWRYCGTMLLMLLLIGVSLIPAGIYAGIRFENAAFVEDPIFWVLLTMALVVMFYLGVAFNFALYLATDLQLGPWAALQVSRRVVSRHWFVVFALLVVAWLIAMLGLLGCLIGVIFTMPFFYGIVAQAYEDIFGLGQGVA